MTTLADVVDATAVAAPTPVPSSWRTVRRGLRLAPQITAGLSLTLTLSLLATLGRLAVPIAVQQTVDHGLKGGGEADLALVAGVAVAGALVLALTGWCTYLTNLRVYRATERGLAALRTQAFDHVHALTTLTQDSERRATLVARVTTDVDTISAFVQFGGLISVISAGQLLLATAAMAWYSWPLAVLVWVWFIPLFLTLPRLQRRVSVAYTVVRQRIAVVYSAVSESVLGASTIRSYAVQDRARTRLDDAVGAHARSAARAQVLVAFSFSAGVLASGLVVALVVGVGTATGVGGGLTLGRLVAFLFLVQLFTTPVQMGTEVLNELQNAAAGWRRVIDLIDTPVTVVEPLDPVDLPDGGLSLWFDGVGYAYPGGSRVLDGVSLDVAVGTRVAIVGETGSGKTTLARLLTRQVDPDAGRVLVGGVDLRRVAQQGLARRLVLVPQEGFLFDDTVQANILFGEPDDGRSEDGQSDDEPAGGATATATARAAATVERLGLSEWVAGLPLGLQTRVGQRGGSLSAGERQLVALARACHVEPDLLVLDEATSSVDPGTEVMLQRALEVATAGRTSVAIAHRLSTAVAADLVVVVDAGRVVDAGSHAELLTRCPVYQHLYQGWMRRSGVDGPAPGKAGGGGGDRDGRIGA
jgi:ATP-binding cassette, subfamily B, bacterial